MGVQIYIPWAFCITLVQSGKIEYAITKLSRCMRAKIYFSCVFSSENELEWLEAVISDL